MRGKKVNSRLEILARLGRDGRYHGLEGSVRLLVSRGFRFVCLCHIKVSYWFQGCTK